MTGGHDENTIFRINTYENTIFRGLFTSIIPSYFDVNYRGTIGFDTLPLETKNRRC